MPTKKEPKSSVAEATSKSDAPKKAKARPARKAPRKAKAPASNPRSWLVREAATWLGGATVGAVAVGAVLYGRAKTDVESYLAHPPTARPSVVWSAPLTVREGQQATLADLAGELMAGGYEHVQRVEHDGQFSTIGSRLDVWTAAMTGPGFEVPASHATIITSDAGTVASVEPGDRVTLRPTVLATIGDPETRRAHVALSAMSPWLGKAVVAVEDGRFRQHPGVDPVGVLRAVGNNLRGREMQGGSTLTQQLAKNLFLSPDRTLQRKVREAFFAVALEQRLSKDEILELYLNEVYLGQAGGVPLYGVEQASRAWFGVSAASLDVGEAATIAGVISSPNAYSPLKHADEARKRRDLALDRMLAQGAVTMDVAAAEKSRELVIDGVLPGAVRRAPWAVDEAVAFSEHALGDGALATGGFAIYTTIDPLLQRAGERALFDGMAEVEGAFPKSKGAEAALVALSPEGAVKALVGGRNYIKSPFDRATDAWREVGSTAKPLVLLAAFDADATLTPLSHLDDSPIARTIDGKTWRPENYDGVFHGDVTIRTAIEASYNIPAIRLSEQLGLEQTQQALRGSGLSRATNWPSVALGAFPATPMQLAGSYTVFPAGGTVAEPWLVQGIAGPNGAEILDFEPTLTPVASARAAALATSILRGVITDGTGARAREYGVTGAVGAKTGTTNDYRDAWMVGFTPDLVAAVWVGRDKGANIGLSGSRAALPTWARFIVAAGPNDANFRLPEGVIGAAVCPQSERPARESCPTRYTELFPVGAVPGKACDLHRGGAVDEPGALAEAPSR